MTREKTQSVSKRTISNLEIRNSKQIQMIKNIQFQIVSFRISNFGLEPFGLFEISSFGFRITIRVVFTRNTLLNVFC